MRRAFFKTLEAGKQNTTECHSAELMTGIKRHRFFKRTV